MSLGLVRAEEKTSQHDQFSKGMVAEFSLKSCELEPGDTEMLLAYSRTRQVRHNFFTRTTAPKTPHLPHRNTPLLGTPRIETLHPDSWPKLRLSRRLGAARRSSASDFTL